MSANATLISIKSHSTNQSQLDVLEEIVSDQIRTGNWDTVSFNQKYSELTLNSERLGTCVMALTVSNKILISFHTKHPETDGAVFICNVFADEVNSTISKIQNHSNRK